MIRLYIVPGSPYARIARIAVALHGLGDRIAAVETTLRDPVSSLLPFNPVGRVPALVLDDGTALTETTLILPVLDRLAPERPPLLPLDGPDAQRIRSAYGRVTGMLDGIAVWNRELRRPPQERSPGVLALEETRANRVADTLEAEVAAGGFAGPAMDAARIALGCSLGYCERRHTVWRWREGRPALSAWFDAIAAHPAFQATIPPPSGI